MHTLFRPITTSALLILLTGTTLFAQESCAQPGAGVAAGCPSCAKKIADTPEKFLPNLEPEIHATMTTANPTQQPPAEPELTPLTGLDQIKADFDAAQGHPRIVLLLSPTCPMCVQGAMWVQKNVVEKYPDGDVNIFAVWFNMIPGDRKARWNPSLLAGENVTNYWDDERILGQWISGNVAGCNHLGPVDWDSFYVFDGGATWFGESDVKACGSPIVPNAGRLGTALKDIVTGE